MSKTKLKPFSIAGVLSYCPECGATGDYELLADAAKDVSAAWDEAGQYPDTLAEREKLGNAIERLTQCINMQRAT